MLFRKAETCEAEAIRALYQAVIGTPFCTWDESYPGETEIAGDLSAGALYVLEEGLPGYREYKKRVRYKVIPHVW